MMLARTCSGLSSPGGTAPTVTPELPNSIVDMLLMVSPFFGDTKKTRRPPAVDPPEGARLRACDHRKRQRGDDAACYDSVTHCDSFADVRPARLYVACARWIAWIRWPRCCGGICFQPITK